MKILKSETKGREIAATSSPSLKSRMTDLVIFSGFLALSGIAILAFAIATPIILLISAIVGLTGAADDRGNWRPAAA